MEIKIDTKEKFHVITPQCEKITAIIADEIVQKIDSLVEHEQKSVVLNMENINTLNETTIDLLKNLHTSIYNNKGSFVLCQLQKGVITTLKEEDLYEVFNITPTESEAWDIVQMEEIEREMFDE